MKADFKKTFTEIVLPSKDIIVLIRYAHGCTAHFIYCYNSISNTYMGLKADSFISTIRGLLYACPDFFQIGEDYRRELVKLGFDLIPPTEKEISHYETIYCYSLKP